MTAGTAVRPLEAGLQPGERPDDCVLVIFGASGDLATRELVPSLFELHAKDLLPERLAVVGVARRDWSDEEYRRRMRRSVEENCTVGCEAWDAFAPALHFHTLDVAESEDFRSLARRIDGLRSEARIPDRVLFHLALPPFLFEDTVAGLREAGLSTPDDGDAGWRRLVVEKPFGRDLESARALDRSLKRCFPEPDIYRIDHYLGKETVQNMLVFRFGNPGFEPIWNRDHIDHVQITVAESKGVAGRGDFYESTGVVRDMVQNHLLQLLCVVAVEPPTTFDARAFRDETVKVLRSVRVARTAEDDPAVVTGQYDAGEVAGDAVRGYRAEEDVDPDSRTPTYAALELELDSWRWAGVPFYLRTGKRLARKLTEVVIHFRPTPHRMFRREAAPSLLAFRLQPDEGIIRTFVAKRPGPELVMEPVQMRFTYADAFDVEHPPRAYAWLLHDAMRGDPTLFARSDWIEEAWRLVDPVVEQSAPEDGRDVRSYRAGSWGPDAAAELLARDGRAWTEV